MEEKHGEHSLGGETYHLGIVGENGYGAVTPPYEQDVEGHGRHYSHQQGYAEYAAASVKTTGAVVLACERYRRLPEGVKHEVAVYLEVDGGGRTGGACRAECVYGREYEHV